MPGHTVYLLSLVTLFSLLARGAQGETPRPAEGRKTNREIETGTDSYGDPLPKGCWARIGSIRWRHGCRVRAVAFHPDGKALLAASEDGSVRVWESSSGKEVRRFSGHHRLLQSFAISRTGRDLAVVTDENLYLWDYRSGKRRWVQPATGLSSLVTVAFSPDGTKLATGGLVDGARLWDAKTGKKLAYFPYDEPARGNAIPPQGERTT